MKNMNFYINLTRECNYRCKYCNRLRDVVTGSCLDREVSLYSVRKAMEKVKKYCEGKNPPIRIERMKIGGGEPTLYPEVLQSVCEVVMGSGIVNRVWVMTNGSLPMVSLPSGCTYKISPVAGKEAFHHPFLISPKDVGVKEEDLVPAGDNCLLMGRCGRCFDVHGFTFCDVAGGLGELLGVNPYKEDVVMKRDMRICQHCPYNLKKWPLKEWLVKMTEEVREKRMEYPSKTWKKMLERWGKGRKLGWKVWGEP